MRKFQVTVNGVFYEVDVEEISSDSIAKTIPLTATTAVPAALQVSPAAKTISPSAKGSVINSPMPGVILDVAVKVGDIVKEGNVLMLLEAMKMENEIMSPKDGKVSVLNVQKGSTVHAGDVLIVIE